jgi:hypothetical protein
MNKSILTALLASMLVTPVTVQAKSSSDCAMAKYMAGHALTVIKGGATLDQTLGMFENSSPNVKIIKEIYSRKDSIVRKKDAEKIGANMCMKENSRV